jgi:UDP-N-acetylmuramate dehydrogenase
VKALVKGVRNELMSAHTAWRVGGPAEVFLRVSATDDLLEAVRAAREQELPVFMLGGGTNILVADRGITGLVIENKVNDVKIEGTSIVATAGTPMAHLAAVAARSGIAGLEFAATIPGSVGGAIHGNSGCWGTETADVLEQAVLADLDGNVRMVPAAALEYRYRHSALQGTPIIVLQGTFGGREGERQSIVRRIKEMANERLQKQPLNQPNSGSTFKNPPGDHAGRLAEAVGAKGLRIGGAVVSEKHANFIITSAGATAADVRALIVEVQRRVREQFGIELEPEVEFVGEWEA